MFFSLWPENFSPGHFKTSFDCFNRMSNDSHYAYHIITCPHCPHPATALHSNGTPKPKGTFPHEIEGYIASKLVMLLEKIFCSNICLLLFHSTIGISKLKERDHRAQSRMNDKYKESCRRLRHLLSLSFIKIFYLQYRWIKGSNHVHLILP